MYFILFMAVLQMKCCHKAVFLFDLQLPPVRHSQYSVSKEANSYLLFTLHCHVTPLKRDVSWWPCNPKHIKCFYIGQWCPLFVR